MNNTAEKVKVKSDIVKWVIRNSKVFIDSMPVDFRAKVNSWAEVDTEIEITDIVKLSKYTKRPITTLLLPAPPKDEIKPKDFRGLKENNIFDKDAEIIFRNANFLLYSIKYLIDSLNLGNQQINQNVEFTYENLPDKGKLIKDTMEKWGITNGFQKEMQSSEEVLEFLINKIEGDSVFVFRFSNPSFSGFSFVNPIKAIFINKLDKIERQVFTALHEYAHIKLNENAACGRLQEKEPKIEEWCDGFASNFLINNSEYDKMDKPVSKNQLIRYCNLYKVSKSMLLFNLFKKGIINEYKGEQIPFIRGKKGKKDKKTNSRRVEKDNRLEALISKNLERGNISYSDANRIEKLAG